MTAPLFHSNYLKCFSSRVLYGIEYPLSVLANTLAFLFSLKNELFVYFSLDQHRSGSDAAFPLTSRSQPRLRPREAKHHEELIPMAHLDRRAAPPNLSGRRGNSVGRHRFTRADHLAPMPKARFAVREVEEYESEGETETMAPARPLVI